MGLFSALRDQFSSSPVPAFKREWLATLNYIQNLSYNEINDSKVVASAKIRQHMTILTDFCARKVTNPRSEKFTFYWHGEKEITMFAALYIAGRYVQKLELGYRLSDDQTDQIMQEVMCGITTEDYNQILLKYL
jgi:hypothetical protein